MTNFRLLEEKGRNKKKNCFSSVGSNVIGSGDGVGVRQRFIYKFFTFEDQINKEQ